MDKQNNAVEEKINHKGYGELIIPLLIIAFLTAYWIQTGEVAFISLIFPGIISAGIIIMVISVVIKTLWNSREQNNSENSQEEVSSRKTTRKAIVQRMIFIGLTFIAILMFNTLGAFLALILLTISIMFLLGVRKITHLILFPIIFVFIILNIFEHVFNFFLPQGVLW